MASEKVDTSSTEFKMYESKVYDLVFESKISDEWRKELETERAEGVTFESIERCFALSLSPFVASLVIYWQDQYNMWHCETEEEAEAYAIAQLQGLEQRYKFRM